MYVIMYVRKRVKERIKNVDLNAICGAPHALNTAF
jgi:hypothetical protein